MGIAASIVSAVLRSVVGDKLGSGLAKDLIGISIDGISEKGINEITDFIDTEKSKIESILSKENMKSMNIPEDYIDYVVVEIKDLFHKISITDEVLRQCKYDSMRLKDFMWNEYVALKNKPRHIECESEIKACLFAVAKALTKVMCESEEFSQNMLLQISRSVDDANVGLQKMSEYMKENFGKLDDNSQIVINILLTILEQIQKMNMQDDKGKSATDEEKKFKNNKKEDYIKNWNSRLFLHIDNDENPITLADAFVMPDYYINKCIERIGLISKDKLGSTIDRFIKYNRTSTLLITGVPGIGKSSITSWMANQYKDDEKFVILRFRDWDSEELENGLLKSICNTLKCNKSDLEDKILLLDGYDEMKSLNIRDKLLSDFWNDLKDFDFIKVIITSRPAYIDPIYFQNVIEVQRFDINKVDFFCRKVTGSGIDKKEKIESNLEVLGIPVILYMAIMSNVDIRENPTKPELYNRIFAKVGGIFDKFSLEGVEYDKGSQVLRNINNIEKYLKFLRDAAFVMFEKNNLSVSQNECPIPKLEVQRGEISVLEFPIKHLFENTKTDIEFIHKSIYDYFVSEYFFISINETICLSNKEIASILGKLFKNNNLSPEILEFLKYKIEKSQLYKVFDAINKSFQLMIQDGMTYYTGECYKNVITCEMNVFANMLELIHLWDEGCSLSLDDSFCRYLIYNECFGLNLKGVILRLGKDESKNKMLDLTKAVSIPRVNLRGADLRDADLEGVDLNRSDLSSARFQFANLVYANLSKAILKNASLIGADLRCANLTDADLTGAELDRSEWYAADVKKIFSQLKSTKFTYIVIADYKKKRLYKNELFPDINSPSDSDSNLFLNSELRQNLEEAGIDLLDFVMMNDDEKMKALEANGLDSHIFKS